MCGSRSPGTRAARAAETEQIKEAVVLAARAERSSCFTRSHRRSAETPRDRREKNTMRAAAA